MSREAWVTAFVSLGSNLGDRSAQLRAALERLRAAPGVRAALCSPVFETAPVGPPGQGPYLNAVARVETRLAPRALLALLLDVERELGRVRTATRNEARTLDLDLLFHGQSCVDEPGLRVPHPRLHERPFVLAPLRAIAPGWRHPELGASVEELVARLERSGRWNPEEVVRWRSSP